MSNSPSVDCTSQDFLGCVLSGNIVYECQAWNRLYDNRKTVIIYLLLIAVLFFVFGGFVLMEK